MELILEAKPRTVLGKQNKKLRKLGALPAVLYGPGKSTVSLEIPTKEFHRVYRQAGENTLIDLVIGQEKKKVLIHDVAKHYMKDEPIHVDFYEVDLTRKIHTHVPLHFVGVSPAVKELGGILIKNLSEIEVEALPGDLPHFIEVNLEKLQTFNDVVRISNLAVSDKVKILGHKVEDVITSVQPPRTEAELEELEKSTAEAEKAVIEGLAKEEEKAPDGEEEAEDKEKAEEPKEEVKKK